MKKENSDFCWNYLVTLSDGKSYDIMHGVGTITQLRRAFEKHNISVSNSTLYRMQKPVDRTYGIVMHDVEVITQLRHTFGKEIVDWHFQMGRRYPPF